MPDTKVSLANPLTGHQLNPENLSFPTYRAGAAPNDWRVTFKDLRKMMRKNTYVYDPTGDPSTDTAAWESLTAAVNTNTPVGRSSEIIIGDTGQPLAVDGNFSATLKTSEFLRGCWVRGETKNSRIEFRNEYVINWGRYGNPVRTTDNAANGYTWFERGTMDPMLRWSSLIMNPSISLARDDYVLLWSDDDIPFDDLAPHNTGAYSWTVSRTATGGSYILTVDGVPTSPILVSDDLVTLRSKIEAAAGLSPLGAQNVIVSGTTASYSVTMSGAKAKQSPVRTLTVDTSSLTGGTATVTARVIGKQRAAQLHRVSHADAGGWVIDGFMVDPLTTAPKICKIEMLRGCGMSDLTFSSNMPDQDGLLLTDPLLKQITAVSAQRCHNFRAENIDVDDSGCGHFGLNLCTDSEIAGFNGVRQFNNRRNYAVLFGVCTNTVYRDSVWHNTRHMISSHGLQDSPTDGIRYGTSIGCKATNLSQYISGDAIDTSFAGMDLHAEGWGWELEGCRVFVSARTDNFEEIYAYSTRARNTRFISCRAYFGTTQPVPVGDTWFEGYYGMTGCGLRIMANDCVVDGFHQNGGWRGAWIRPDIVSEGFVPRRTKIIKGDFDNINGAALFQHIAHSDVPVDIEVSYNTFRNCGARYFPAGTPPWMGAIIQLSQGTGHKIRYNNADKFNNYYFIAAGNLVGTNIDCAYNSLRGYGSGRAGVRGAIGDPKITSTTEGESLNTSLASKNQVDP